MISLHPGTLITDRYQLLRPLGSGGTAHVWAALDISLNREVAVKILSANSAGPAERERLRREARVLAALEHPRITMVFDFVEVADHSGAVVPVLVTELLDGMSLEDRLRSGPMEPDTAIQVCAQLADALAVAHRAGITHRDVKPGNAMLTSRGLKLLDFGIARGEADTRLTGTMMVIGTPVCMAPEQWSGRGAQPASDVYALGCVLYWCLAGHTPYPSGDLGALGMAHLQAPPPPLPVAVPAAVVDLYLACMAKDPAHRPTSEQAHAVLAAPAGGTGAAVAGGWAGATRQMPASGRTAPTAPMGAPGVPTAPMGAPGAGHRGAAPVQSRRATPALLIGGGVLLVVVIVALVLSLGHGNAPSTGTSVDGSGSPTPTTTAGAGVGTVVIPSDTAVTATRTSPSSSPTPAATLTHTAPATSSPTSTPTSTTSNPSSGQATAALSDLQTIAGQLKTLNQQQSLPDAVYQDLLARVNDMEQSVTHDEQNTGSNPYSDVHGMITSFDQQVAQDAQVQQITEGTAAQLTGGMQQVSTDLSSGN